MMDRLYIRNNTICISVLVFIALFVIVHMIKPGILYKSDGSIREFGINSNQKTIIPIWGVTILLAVISYLVVQYYLIHPNVYGYMS